MKKFKQQLRAPMGAIQHQDTVFAGYTIKLLLSGEFSVSKNGQHIFYAIDASEAIRTIRENLMDLDSPLSALPEDQKAHPDEAVGSTRFSCGIVAVGGAS